MFERALFAERSTLQKLLERQQEEVIIDSEPDDEGAEAARNLSRHLALAALDRERRTLNEIEGALQRMKAGNYGVCQMCEGEISTNRLKALPWTRFCISCAERRSPS